jgi:3-oxoacyl-[acyl-carrier protein] reductase
MLAGRGAAVALLDLDREALEDAAGALGGADVLALRGDVTEPDDCEAAVAACVERWGHLDVLVNNAGLAGANKLAWELEDETWLKVLDVNLNGTFYFCRAAARRMREQSYGRIVNVASIAGKEGNPNASHYSAAKAGIIALTESLGKELATEGVLVNAVAPAVIDGTPQADAVSPEHLEYMRSRIPMGRFGRLEEAARLVAFLASRQLSFSTGAVYDLSGGRATYRNATRAYAGCRLSSHTPLEARSSATILRALLAPGCHLVSGRRPSRKGHLVLVPVAARGDQRDFQRRPVVQVADPGNIDNGRPGLYPE